MSQRKITHSLVMFVAGSVAMAAAPSGAATYYVDFENGVDSNDGLSPATAWKRSPGDDGSTGRAKNLTLQPGDRVLFRGGVRYRGVFWPRAAGTAQNPVIFDGGSWGNQRAIMDGSNLLQGARKCANAAECFNNPNWKHLWRIPVAPTARWTDWLFAGDRPLQPAQYPDVPLLQADDTSKYLTIPRSETSRLQGGAISQPLPDGLQAGMPVLALWIQGNVIAMTSDISVSNTGVLFTGNNWVNGSRYPYTDRDNKFALMNLPAMVRRPGTYAISPKDGYAIAWPWTPLHTDFSIGGGRHTINLQRVNHAVFRGFTFANYAARPGDYGSGIAILSNAQQNGVTIENNIFRAAMNHANGRAFLTLRGSNTIIRKNIFTELPWTSAIQIDSSWGPTLIECNQINNIGRTAIRLNNTGNAHINANFITRVKNIHGNGITLYSDTRNARVTNNVVTDTDRPLTMNGVHTNFFSSGDKSILIADNIFIGASNASPAVASYGNTQHATLTGNFLSAPNTALDLRGTETGFSATSNTFVGRTVVHNNADMFDPGANIYQEADGNGTVLTGAVSQHGLPAQCQ